MCNVTPMPPLSSNKAEPTLALKPRGDITRSPKQGYQWPHKKKSCPPKILKNIYIYDYDKGQEIVHYGQLMDT